MLSLVVDNNSFFSKDMEKTMLFINLNVHRENTSPITKKTNKQKNISCIGHIKTKLSNRRKNKNLQNNKGSLLFNQTCLYIYIYIYIYIYNIYYIYISMEISISLSMYMYIYVLLLINIKACWLSIFFFSVSICSSRPLLLATPLDSIQNPHRAIECTFLLVA